MSEEETAPVKHPNMASAILGVMRDVGYVFKSGKIKIGGSYSFAGETDLLRALRPAMIIHGLCMVPVGSIIDPIHEEVTNRNGKSIARTVRVVATYRLMHESGEHVDLQVAGEGQDRGDKATAKANTIALKYALRQAFLIETGDDPDKVRPEFDGGGNHGGTRKPDPAKRTHGFMLLTAGSKDAYSVDDVGSMLTEMFGAVGKNGPPKAAIDFVQKTARLDISQMMDMADARAMVAGALREEWGKR